MWTRHVPEIPDEDLPPRRGHDELLAGAGHGVDLVRLVVCPGAGHLGPGVPGLDGVVPAPGHDHVVLGAVVNTLHPLLVLTQHSLLARVHIYYLDGFIKSSTQ